MNDAATSPVDDDVLDRLEAVVRQRLRERPAGSYVVELDDGGDPAVAAKLVEEAYEVVHALGEEEETARRAALIHEAADLLFHLFVLLGRADVTLDDVRGELAGRFGLGGLTEKSRRKAGDA